MRTQQACVVLLAVAHALLFAFQAPAADGEWKTVEGEAFTFTEVRQGIWHAVGSGSIAVGSNGAVVVLDNEVLIVDSHLTPTAGRALLADLPRVTDKPVRYLVNTHFHFDHTHGNEVFGPEVDIIGHEFTHEKLATGGSKSGRGYEGFVASTPQRLEAMRMQLDGLSDEERAVMEQRMAAMKALYEESEAAEPRPLSMALREALTIHRGGREIRLLHLGRGHTGGDVVVYLPAEKVVISGDLLTAGIPYMGDSFLPEWIEALDALAALDIEVVLPGHGAAYTETERIGWVQDYFRDLWSQASELHAAGVSAVDAQTRIDLTRHAEHFPEIRGPGTPFHATDRIWELLDAGYESPIER